MYFSLLTNDWNYVAFDEFLALLDQLKKKAVAKSRKRTTILKQPLDNKLLLRCYTFKSIFIASNACIYITHVVYLLFMLPSRMAANHMCSVVLFLPLTWVDLGPLQHPR